MFPGFQCHFFIYPIIILSSLISWVVIPEQLNCSAFINSSVHALKHFVAPKTSGLKKYFNRSDGVDPVLIDV